MLLTFIHFFHPKEKNRGLGPRTLGVASCLFFLLRDSLLFVLCRVVFVVVVCLVCMSGMMSLFFYFLCFSFSFFSCELMLLLLLLLLLLLWWGGGWRVVLCWLYNMKSALLI